MNVLNHNDAYKKLMMTLNAVPHIPHPCSEEALHTQSGTAINSNYNGFELTVVHQEEKIIERLFEALQNDFSSTNYDVTISGFKSFNGNKVLATIYITEKE